MAKTQPKPGAEAPGASRADLLAVAVAGQGVLRRVVLYTAMFACMGLAYYVPVLVVPAIVCGALLLSTDTGLG